MRAAPTRTRIAARASAAASSTSPASEGPTATMRSAGHSASASRNARTQTSGCVRGGQRLTSPLPGRRHKRKGTSPTWQVGEVRRGVLRMHQEPLLCRCQLWRATRHTPWPARPWHTQPDPWHASRPPMRPSHANFAGCYLDTSNTSGWHAFCRPTVTEAAAGLHTACAAAAQLSLLPSPSPRALSSGGASNRRAQSGSTWPMRPTTRQAAGRGCCTPSRNACTRCA